MDTELPTQGVSGSTNQSRGCTCHPNDRPLTCQYRYALTDCRISALAEAMWQLLDDMGADGHGVCELAKAKARIAFEPFREEPLYGDMDYTVDRARSVVSESEASR